MLHACLITTAIVPSRFQPHWQKVTRWARHLITWMNWQQNTSLLMRSLIIVTSHSTDEQFMDYVARAKERSSVSLEAEVAPGDKILTLATCEYSRADGRYIVHAVLRQIVEP